MATAIGDLVVRLGMVTGPFTRGVNQAQKSVGTFRSHLGGLVNMVPGIGGLQSALGSISAGPIAAAAGAVTGLAVALRSAFHETDRIADISQELGIATGQLIGLEFAARRVGVETTSLQSSLQKMTVNAAAAASGSKEMQRIFARLNLDAKEFVKLPLDRQFSTLADAFAGIPLPAERARLAIQIFGRGNIQMIRLLSEGSRGLAEATAQAKAFGVEINTNSVKAVDRWKIATAELGLAWDGFSQRVLRMAAPAVKLLSSGISTATGAFARFTDFLSDPFGARTLTEGWETIGNSADKAAARVKVSTAAIVKAQQDADEWRKIVAASHKEQLDFEARFASHMKAVNDDVAKFNEMLKPPLTIFDKYMQQVARINELFSMGLLTLEKRNALVRMSHEDFIAGPARERAMAERATGMARGEDLARSLRTPLEEFRAAVMDADKLRRGGFISPDIFSRAVAKAKADFEMATGAGETGGIDGERFGGGRDSTREFSGAMERGSAEAWSTIVSAWRGAQDRPSKGEKEIVKSLDRVRTEIAKKPAETVVEIGP